MEIITGMGNFDGIVRYTPAKLTRSEDGWYVSFHVLDPVSQKLKLQRTRAGLGRIPDVREREKQAKRILAEVNRKLALGGIPYYINSKI